MSILTRAKWSGSSNPSSELEPLARSPSSITKNGAPVHGKPRTGSGNGPQTTKPFQLPTISQRVKPHLLNFAKTRSGTFSAVTVPPHDSSNKGMFIGSKTSKSCRTDSSRFIRIVTRSGKTGVRQHCRRLGAARCGKGEGGATSIPRPILKKEKPAGRIPAGKRPEVAF